MDWDAKNRELLTRYQQGDKEALDEFLECNRGLVHHLLRRYRRLPLAMEEDDLEQLGFLGLLEAARRPQALKQAYLSNYLSFCIRKRLYLGIWQEGYLVHLPRRRHDAVVQARRIEGERLVRGKPEEWGCRRLGLSAVAYRERLRCYKLFLDSPASLDAERGEEGLRLMDLLEADEDNSPEARVQRKLLRERLQRLLRRLSGKPLRLLRYCFGLGDEKRCSLAEAGKRCGLSAQEAQSLLEETLRRLEKNL